MQNPQQAFSDPDLRVGQVVTNKMGLPRPISGNFATVFEVKHHESRWAVRCFLREVTNQQQRYAAISAHLKLHALPCMVNFEYLPEGIRIRGKWYPILKMDWTPGIRLDTYIEDHLSAPHDLEQLANRWVTLCHSLRQAQIAHGDLQHGNILVTERDEIKLIDYDGMIVPAVIGLDNNEIGHRHYQHPSRKTDAGITAANFGSIDNFSCHVIGLSLFALSMEPALWKQTQAGEENLLFRDTDYESPAASKIFARLAQHEDQRIRAVGQAMLEAIRPPLYLDVPPFDRRLTPAQTRISQMKTWLLSQVAPEMPAPVATAEPSAQTSWIFDHLDPASPAPLDFSADFILHERISVEVDFQRSRFGIIEQFFPVYALVQLMRRYPNYPLVTEKANMGRVTHILEQQLLEVKAKRKTVSRLIVEMDRRYQQEVRTLEASVAQLTEDLQRSHQQEARELPRLERALHSTTADRAESTGASTPITAEDVQFARERYALAQRDLEDQRRTALRQLEQITTNSDDLRLMQNLRDDLDAIEAEVTALQEQHTRATRERGRYELVTLRRFLWRIAATSPF